ncbi:MAG: hypothetical protein PSV22_06995 [Pseudolabrys sp.]|nr:hypothetical protein [Pseudolabrys sp.]
MTPAINALRRRQIEIDREIASLQAERERVVRALDVLNAVDLFQDRDSPLSERRRRPGSLKQMAYTVIHDAGKALTAAQILELIESEFGQRIERTSMSPQLSRLGQENFLKRNGNLWSIDQRKVHLGKEVYLLKSNRDLL